MESRELVQGLYWLTVISVVQTQDEISERRLFAGRVRLRNMKALVVDDSSTIRMFLRSILVPLGFEVTMAKNGNEGLEELVNPPQPDLVLIDWHMPEMDGLQLLTEIRSRPELDQMTVVMVTAENDLSQISLALDSGANEYVMKPLTREIVTEKLQMLGF